MKSTNKRVCVINKETNMIMRVSREFAINAIAGGIYKYTTKSALKKFMNRDLRLKRNEKRVVNFDINGSITRRKGAYNKIYTVLYGYVNKLKKNLGYVFDQYLVERF